MKLSRIVINKFLRFKHVEIDFEKFTSINGKMISQDGLRFLSEAIKFVLDCSEFPLQKLLYKSTDIDDSSHDYPGSFVEANVVYPDKTQRKFTKVINGIEILFQIDGVRVLQSQYIDELLNSGILVPPLNTLYIGPGSVNKVSTVSDLKRAAFIELFSGSEEVVRKYKDLSASIRSVKIDLDASLKNQVGLASEKKRIKAKRESTEKRSQLMHELELKAKELELFNLYHNNKFLDSAYDGTLNRELRLDELKDSLAANFREVEERIAMEITLNEQRVFAKARFESESQEIQESLQEMNRKIENNDNLKLELLMSARMFEAKTVGVQKEIEKLGERSEENAELDEEFQQLQESFEANNEFKQFKVSNLSSSASIDELELLKDSIDSNQDSAGNIAREMSLIEQEIEKVYHQRQEKRQARKSIEDKQEEVDDLTKQLNMLQNSAMNGNEKRSTSFRQKIIDELKKKFPERVIGRISELFKPKAGATQNFIRDRLGNFSEAIVVDSIRTAEECVAVLKTKQLSLVNEIFLPLNELVLEQKTSKEFLQSGKLPTTVDCVFIENLVETLKEHEKVFLFCFKPSLVVHSLSDAELLLKLPENKKLDIVSIDTSTCFRKQGFTEVTGAEEKTGSNEEMVLEMETKLIKLRTELVQLIPQRARFNREILLLDAQMERLRKSIEPLRDLLSFYTKEVEKLKAERNRISMELDLDKIKLYKKMQSNMDMKKIQHFREFCENLGITCIDDYLTTRATPKELVKMHSASLRLEISTYDEDKAFIQEILEDTNFAGNDSSEIFQLKDKLTTKRHELYKAADELCAIVQNYFEIKRDVKQQEEISDELTLQIDDIYEQIYDNLSKIQLSLKENYEILIDNFVSHSSLSLEAGNICNFIVPPDNVPNNFQLVSEQLKTIEINFDHLSSNLKKVVEVAAKTYSMTKNLKKLRESIEKSSGKVSETVSDQRLKRVTEELKEATKVHESFQQKMAELRDEMFDVKVERKRIFEECLKALNDGISEFCELSFGRQIDASLKAINEAEPYLGEIIYFWSSSDNIGHCISEFKPDPVAALALLFAVLKFKKQSFVILDDAVKEVINIASLEKFMQNQNHLQIVSFTSQITDESSNFIVRQKSQAFVVTPFN